MAAPSPARKDSLTGVSSDVEQACTPKMAPKLDKHMSASAHVLNLADLPPHVAEALKSLDKDGDGTIDLGELHGGAEESARSVQKVRISQVIAVRPCPR
jgi:hypothetical protein